MTDKSPAQSFIERWQRVAGSERANYHARSLGTRSSCRLEWRLLARRLAGVAMFVGF